MLSFSYTPQAQLVYELAEAFFLHVLYVRNVLPEPYEALRREFASPRDPEEKLKYSERKKHKTIELIGEILHRLRSLSARLRVERVAVLLGPSANNPKETYTVDFYPQHGTAPDEPYTVKQAAQAKRHLIHKMIEHQSTEECAPSRKTNVFLALQISDDSLASKSESELHELISMFSFRDTFKIKDDPSPQTVGTKRAFGGRKRVKPFHLHIVSNNVTTSHILGGNNEKACSVSSADDASVNLPQPSGGRWLVLSKGFKSFPV